MPTPDWKYRNWCFDYVFFSLYEIIVVKFHFACKVITSLNNLQLCICLGMVFEWWIWDFTDPAVFIYFVSLEHMAYIYLRGRYGLHPQSSALEQRITDWSIEDKNCEPCTAAWCLLSHLFPTHLWIYKCTFIYMIDSFFLMVQWKWYFWVKI